MAKSKIHFVICVLTFVIISLFAQKGYAEVTVGNSALVSKKEFLPGEDLIYIKAVIPDENKDDSQIENITFKLVSALGADTEEVILTETGGDTGVFRVSKGISILSEKRITKDGILQVSASQDTITVMNEKGRVFAILTVLPAIESFSVNVDSLQTAGKPFGVEIVAQDKQGRTLANYTGAAKLEIGPDTSQIVSFADGRAKIYTVYHEAGKVKIRVSDTNNRQGESNEIFFIPAKLEVESSPLETVGKEFSLKITALNFNNEITYNYTGAAAIKPIKGNGLSSGDILFNQGIAEARVTYNKWGEMKFVVYDREYEGVRGRSESIFFNAYRFEVEIEPPPKDRKKFYFEELFNGRVTVFDYQGNKILKYGGVAILEPVENVDMPQKLYFGWRDKGEDYFYVSGVSDKPFKVRAYDAPFPEIKGESGLISLTPAQIKAEVMRVKGNKARVKIKIEDKLGRVVREDNSTFFTVHLIESSPDESARLMGPKQIKAKKGVATVTITDKQKETVSVFIESEPYLEAIPLEVNFE